MDGSSESGCKLGIGYWWLCGDGRARKNLPPNWKGHCTGGYLAPPNSFYNGPVAPMGILRSPWKRVTPAIPLNPLVERPTGYHSFVTMANS